ncbi:ATP-binding protein [Amycolatopsis nigrescens]|uniref:ATP-binding protein n=1 Tax=Amycolatopsis nigrescens TaxID=381445 RepID=UPI000373612F|nr:ATP-binding protein [Amycolatopsis nigrescens]
MSQIPTTGELEAMLASVVELRLPTELDQLVVARAVAESVATRGEFDLDGIADIKLATDEACSRMMAGAAMGAVLSCRFQSTCDLLRVKVSASAAAPYAACEHNFGRHVLNRVTDSVEIAQEAAGVPGFPTSIEFTKRKRSR